MNFAVGVLLAATTAIVQGAGNWVSVSNPSTTLTPGKPVTVSIAAGEKANFTMDITESPADGFVEFSVAQQGSENAVGTRSVLTRGEGLRLLMTTPSVALNYNISSESVPGDCTARWWLEISAQESAADVTVTGFLRSLNASRLLRLGGPPVDVNLRPFSYSGQQSYVARAARMLVIDADSDPLVQKALGEGNTTVLRRPIRVSIKPKAPENRMPETSLTANMKIVAAIRRHTYPVVTGRGWGDNQLAVCGSMNQSADSYTSCELKVPLTTSMAYSGSGFQSMVQDSFLQEDLVSGRFYVVVSPSLIPAGSDDDDQGHQGDLSYRTFQVRAWLDDNVAPETLDGTSTDSIRRTMIVGQLHHFVLAPSSSGTGSTIVTAYSPSGTAHPGNFRILVRRGALPSRLQYDVVVPSNRSFIGSPSVTLSTSEEDPFSNYYIGIEYGPVGNIIERVAEQTVEADIRAINI